MTKNQKKLLKDFSLGTDVNMYAQVSIALGKKQANSAAKTIMSLLRLGMLQSAKSGGFEISDRGRAAAEKIPAPAKESP
jgi:hypothetical protein